MKETVATEKLLDELLKCLPNKDWPDGLSCGPGSEWLLNGYSISGSESAGVLKAYLGNLLDPMAADYKSIQTEVMAYDEWPKTSDERFAKWLGDKPGNKTPQTRSRELGALVIRIRSVLEG